MNIFFRVDASLDIGYGHLMRCLSLAEEFKKLGDYVFFICRELKGNLIDKVKKRGIPIFTIPETGSSNFNWENDQKFTKDILKKNSVDLLVIDHYGIDERWEKRIRPYVYKVMVIDDLADRRHDCDLLLDQTFHRDMRKRYDQLIPAGAYKLLGPSFVLLRPEFRQLKQNRRERDGIIKRILIFFGGSDPTDETTKALKAVEQINDKRLTVDVVVGKANENVERIRNRCNVNQNFNFHCQVDYIAGLMDQSDLSIGAGGTSTWERCYLGLPTVIITVANNQVELCNELSEKEALIYLGHYREVNSEQIRKVITELKKQPEKLNKMTYNSLMLFEDERVCASVVIRRLLNAR